MASRQSLRVRRNAMGALLVQRTPALDAEGGLMPVTSAKELRALVKSFPWKDWEKKLEPGFTQVYRDVVSATGADAALGQGVSFDVDDPFLQEHMTAYVGERITQMSRSTQKDVARVVRQALAQGADLATADLKDKILAAARAQYDDYEAYRALRIARTESAIAYNHGGVLGGSQAGFDTFDVVDGTDDEECAAANGAVWSTTKCLNNPIAHPNCQRAFFPHVDDGTHEED